MSENEDVRKNGYYTVIFFGKDKEETFYGQCYSLDGRLYALPTFLELNPAFVKEVLIDSHRENL